MQPAAGRKVGTIESQPFLEQQSIVLIRTRNLRLWVLLILDEMPGYQANDDLLLSLLEHIGLPTAKVELQRQLDWLASRAYIQILKFTHGSYAMAVAELMAAGQDIAKGLAHDDGVARPPPK